MTSREAIAPTEKSHAQYAWAEHLIWMEGGEPVETDTPVVQWKGIVLAVLLTLAAFGIPMALKATGWSRANLVDPVLVSMLLGLLWGNFAANERWLAGMSVAVRRLLPVGIILLGARMNFFDAMRIGLPGLAMSVGVVVTAFVLLLVLGRLFKVDNRLACLLGVGTGICGGTAIVAIAPILSARERDVMLGVGLVTMLGLCGMLILPPLGGWLGLTQSQFGLLSGLTLQQTPQVIAAGFSYGEEAGQVATVAKLARVCLLAPVAVAMGWWVSRQPSLDGGMGGETHRKPWYRLLPGFALGFLILAVVKTMGLLPEISMNWESLGGRTQNFGFDTSAALKSASSFLLAMGMVGVGYQTRFSQGRNIGWRPIVATTLASVVISLAVLLVVKFFFP